MQPLLDGSQSITLFQGVLRRHQRILIGHAERDMRL